MKKILKIFFVFVFVFILISLGKFVEANSIQKISMDVYIKENGDAQVTEIWNCNATQGTEVYHPYYNLQTSEIKDLIVREGNKKYTTLSSWNTSGTLSSKAYKCGINNISDGVELCWGISSYGQHTYIVNYTITNFVSELTDSQMVYWTLIPYKFSNTIGHAYIKIHTNFNIADTTDVWGYGNYGGTAYVYDGYIEMQSDGRLDTNEYMTILVKFPKGTFNTKDKLNNNFDYYYNMAEDGATKYVVDNNLKERNELLFGLMVAGVIIFSFVINFIVGTRNIIKINAIVYGKSTLDFGPEGKHIPANVAYYRDIPCRGDIFRAYYIAHMYGLTKNKTDVLGAIILKWLKDSLITIQQKETGLIFKKENTVVVLNEINLSNLTDEKEKQLFKMLYKSSKDGYLESKEFEKWCSRSYSELFSWFDKIMKIESEKLASEGIIKVEEKNVLKIFKSKKYIATDNLKKEAIELAGLKRYLEEYTLIKDRQAIEVHLFEDYLIYAQIMGIAKKVAKEFNDLYPEILEQSKFVSYDYIDFVHLCSTRGIREANVARMRASSYSSGGGGFSSGGGGGGSRGGGGGGGGFR